MTKKTKLPITIFTFFLTLTLAWLLCLNAQAESYETYDGYDSIVRELSSNRYETPSAKNEVTLDTVRFHLGVGLISSSVTLDLPNPYKSGSVLMQGFGARFGIDLFSSHWVAESGIRSFNPERFSSHEIHLREFDLLIVYHTAAARTFDINVGGGMTARYLDISGGISGSNFPSQNITPSSVLTLGFDVGLAKTFSIGAQLSYRSPFVGESADRGSLDGGLHFTGHL